MVNRAPQRKIAKQQALTSYSPTDAVRLFPTRASQVPLRCTFTLYGVFHASSWERETPGFLVAS